MDKKTLLEILNYFLCVIIAVVTIVLIKFQSPILSLFISLVIGAVTVFNLKLGLLLWFVVAPLSSTISDRIVSVPLLFNPALVIGWIVNSSIRHIKIRLDKKTLYLYAYILISVLTVTAINQYIKSFNVIISFISILAISYLITISYSRNRDLSKGIAFCLLLSGLIAIVTALQSLGTTSRLELEGSVRQLSNVLGFAGLFILLHLLYLKKSFNRLFRFILTIGVVPLLIGLILTISRGSILAFFLSFIAATLLYFYKKGSFKAILKSIVYGGVILILVYVTTKDLFVNNFGTYIEVLQKRFEGDNLSSGSSVRQYIWEEVLGRFSTMELLFGAGIDGFRAKAASAGISFYAHSFFVDTVATGGILVLVAICIYLLDILVRAFKTGNLIAFALIIFVVMNFISHGTMTAPLFWIGVALARGAILKHRNDLYQQRKVFWVKRENNQ